MAKQFRKVRKHVPWTKVQHAELRKHSRAKTPVAEVAKPKKRTEGAVRRQAHLLAIGFGAPAVKVLNAAHHQLGR
jgi:hypothetical protein